MNSYRYIAVLILCTVIQANSTISIECARTDYNCFCTRSTYYTEFQCPDEESPKTIIVVGSECDVIEVQCIDMINWHSLDLPLIEIGDVDNFRFRQCPLPTNFAEIMRRLGINNIKELRFDLSEDFANITLTADYFEGLQNVEKLILNSNDIRNIDKHAFTSLNNLLELDLSYNKIKLTEGLFQYLSKLKLLDLSDNELSHLSAEIFQNLTELTVLQLSSNRLTRISRSTFEKLKNLELLELSSNQLEFLPENVFYYLENLKGVGLSANKLKNLPGNLFRNNILLEVININSNPNLTNLPNKLFANLTKLGNIFLIDSGLVDLPNRLFDGLTQLQNISLQANKIQVIPENLFKNLQQLQNLDFSYNKISDLPHEVFSSSTQLKTLNLEGNLLTNIRREPFHNLQNLEILNLSNNRINFIELNSFQGVDNLKEIILANNYFDLPKSNMPDVSLFDNNQKLERIDLSYNNITSIEDIFLTITNLRELDLSYNQISYLSFSDVLTVAFPIQINLEHNNISTVDFDYAEIIARNQDNLDAYTSNSGNRNVLLNGNPLECNCNLYNFARYFDGTIHPTVPILVTIEADQLTCTTPNDFINFPAMKLKPSMLTCSLEQMGIEDGLTEKCSYGFRPWDTSLIVNCTNSNFTKVPELILPAENFFNQTEVFLQGNLITSGPKENMGYENVTKLYLSANKINEFTWLPPKLEVLELANNNISYINYAVLTKLNSSHVAKITLGGNPWICDCSIANLTLFLLSNLAKKQIDANNIRCRDSKQLLVSLTRDDICPSNTSLLLGLGVAFSLTTFFIAILMGLYHCFHQEIKVWLFAHNMLLWCVAEDEIDKDKLYDAFICYSHHDENFVLNELLPVLEQGPQPYKLCLHIRDWLAGEFISKQIATSVMESRRTLVILSPNFLESEWGKMEFRTAHRQALHEGRARVILILYGNIDVDTDLDDELKAYVRTNTYVKWGDRWFWDKLRYALPHSPVKVEQNSQKSENVMVAINEELDDLEMDLENGTNSGSTPALEVSHL